MIGKKKKKNSEKSEKSWGKKKKKKKKKKNNIKRILFVRWWLGTPIIHYSAQRVAPRKTIFGGEIRSLKLSWAKNTYCLGKKNHPKNRDFWEVDIFQRHFGPHYIGTYKDILSWTELFPIEFFENFKPNYTLLG